MPGQTIPVDGSDADRELHGYGLVGRCGRGSGTSAGRRLACGRGRATRVHPVVDDGWNRPLDRLALDDGLPLDVMTSGVRADGAALDVEQYRLEVSAEGDLMRMWVSPNLVQRGAGGQASGCVMLRRTASASRTNWWTRSAADISRASAAPCPAHSDRNRGSSPAAAAFRSDRVAAF